MNRSVKTWVSSLVKNFPAADDVDITEKVIDGSDSAAALKSFPVTST